MIERLKHTFENTNEWLKFGEAKNAGLAAFNLALIIGLLQIGCFVNPALIIGFMLLLAAVFFNVYSILPILNKLYKFYAKTSDQDFENNIDKYNSVYFGDLAKLKPEQVIKLLQKDLTDKSRKTEDVSYENDLAGQIVINSEIAWQKFRVFQISGYLTLCALICLVLYAVISVCSINLT